jgi:ribosomal protein S18 acetylase RimI-like enzyme
MAAQGSLQLRPIRADDSGFLYRLYCTTRQREMALVDWSERQKEEFLQMQFNAQHSHYQENFPQASFDIIEEQEKAIGRLYVDRRKDEIRIVDISLVPEVQQKGLGSQILREILAEASTKQQPVRIHVAQDNPALHLYVRLGFKHVSDAGYYQLMEWIAE